MLKMEKYQKGACVWPIEDEQWLANFLVPKSQTFGVFQLLLRGGVKMDCDFYPTVVLEKDIPQLRHLVFRITVEPQNIKFIESHLHSKWEGIADLLQAKSIKILDDQAGVYILQIVHSVSFPCLNFKSTLLK